MALRLFILFFVFPGFLSVQGESGFQCSPVEKKSYEKAIASYKEMGKSQIIWFASWCGACRKKVAGLSPEQLSATVFIGVQESPKRSRRALRQMLQKHSISPSSLAISCLSDKFGKVAAAYRIKGLPASSKL